MTGPYSDIQVMVVDIQARGGDRHSAEFQKQQE